MLVQSGHPHVVPLGLVDKLDGRIFDSASTSSVPLRSAESKEAVEKDLEQKPPAREVISFSLKANKPSVKDVTTSCAVLQWEDLELPSALSNACVSYEVEMHQVG